VQWAIYLPLVVPLCAAAGARTIASRLPPQVATWLLTLAAVALAALSTAVLALLASSAFLRIPLVATLGHMSVQVIRHKDPASLSAAVGGTLLLALAVLAAGRAGWRRARALVSAARHARCLPGSSQVVVVPDGSADAYAVPGWPGRIVVTEGMLEALNPDERRVLLAHERAHATSHHYMFTALTYLAAAANPLLRPVAAAVTYTVERWADETAARDCGDRRLAARAIGKAALASAQRTAPATARRRAMAMGIAGPFRTRSATRLRGLARFGPVNRLGHVLGVGGAGPVPRRVAALLAPPPRIRPLLVVAVASVVLVSSVAALDAARDLHAVVELAQTHVFNDPT
jgi:Zn-dependent protease with chaperone function